MNETIREFSTAHFRVIVDAVADDYLDLSFDDTGEVLEKLQSGEFVAFCARVRVFHDALGEIASDYLGGCVYADVSDFEDHRECGKYNRQLAASGDNGRCGSYFADMIHTAIAEAREAISKAQGIYIRKG